MEIIVVGGNMLHNKRKIILIIVIICLIGLVGLGISYAYWKFTYTQTDKNIAISKCLKLEMSNESNTINLDNMYPISDEEGRKLTPYSFKITNTCSMSAEYKVNLEMFDMNVLLEEINDLFSLLVKDKNIEFNYHNSYDEIYVNGDYERLKQVFINIIKNSIESIGNSGIIGMDALIINREVLIKISDTGMGMTEEELANVKEMFYTTKKNGTGLGVALSNEIILAHSGKITYDSVKDVGTTCIVSLPI